MIHWRESGQGRAITLLHGISSGADSWHKQLAAPGKARLLAWDMPGYGNSDDLALFDGEVEKYVAALAEMLNQARVGQTVLVGHSLGALIAAAFSALYPGRVSYLVLADPAQGYGQAPAAQRQQVWQQRQQQIAAGGETMARQRAHRLLRPGALSEDIRTVAGTMARLREKGFLGAARLLAEGDIHPWLSRWRGPLQVWCGEQDTITPPERARDLARRYGGTYYGIPDAGHASYLDNPHDVNRLLEGVLEEIAYEHTH
ncbi:alpha/beta fold hydrolase [Shimwellia blattae]|uniref:Putative hydrolase n=1 Tax=Shimwellia blattae (strain ATCC 29907 / DSM 4481 / JCM 1650 / NBRC 105725 / CDC 9005-74) TaxID=630626 RepID=I2B5B2_SHIBC|nr:alpha/beta hydrolase [Shimwellia blattae]AFJ45716.1 putative hydrolase [Shimwellia blattae DSM 4481 = NBRC 105725]GAB82164.1 putative hydrolase [Shimwellia blattae DSM 4481 = NBRC 105725]VDY63198.1 3-oxoadipate enol-lactonase 2 [Shimwellia blattae]VEC20862.1 3-oxoadipate enol-lactonase 2 [Shimwellia blattae]